jgi:ankyrin repeat protein
MWGPAWVAAAGGTTTGDIRPPISHGVLDELLLAVPAQPAGIDEPVDSNMKTALMRVAAEGHVLAVKRLVERGAKVDATSSNGMTALWSAAGNGHDDCVEVLLGGGACVDTMVETVSVLYMATQNGHADVVERLLAGGAKVQGGAKARAPLSIACTKGDRSVVLSQKRVMAA